MDEAEFAKFLASFKQMMKALPEWQKDELAAGPLNTEVTTVVTVDLHEGGPSTYHYEVDESTDFEWPELKPKHEYDTPLAKGPYHDFENILGALVPGLNEARVRCPVHDSDECGWFAGLVPEPMRVTQVVMHLNDQHRWAREEIADWLETLDIDLTIRRVESNEHREGGE